MKKILSFGLCLVLIGNFLSAQVAGDYRSIASTAWNLTTTWEKFNGAGWVAAIDYPGMNTGTGRVTIQNGNAVTLNVSPANPIGDLDIQTGNATTSLTISNTFILNVTDSVIISAPTGGSGITKSIVINGTTAQLNGGSLTLLESNNDNKPTILQYNAAGIVNITGNLTMPGSPALDQRTSINFSSGGTLTVGGNITGGTINGGSFPVTITGNFTNATDINIFSGTITINGNLTGGTVIPVGGGTLNITGNVTNDSLNAGNATINIGGNVSNNPVDAGFTGTIGFTGSGVQTTPATPLTVPNLLMNNAASTLQLGANLTVTGTVTLTNGKINTGTNILTLTNAAEASQLSGGSSSSYVYSSGAGRLRRNGLAAGTHSFPVGTATNYMPVTVVTTVSEDFAVNAFSPASTTGVEGGPAFANLTDMVNALWNIDRPLGGAANATITIQWVNALEGNNFSSLGNTQIGISRFSGTWAVATATSANAAANTVTATFNAFSPFGVGLLGVVLPVKFGAIKAYEKQNGIQLDWKVYSENKVRNYEIERSADGRSYTSIGSLPALYNNTSDGDYGFFDANPLAGTSYYRIRNNDLDGKSAYSIVIRVNRNKTVPGLSLYPNPVVNGIVLLQGSDLGRGKYKINIFGANGQEIFKQQIIHNGGTLTHTIELPPATSKGVYMLSVKDENGNIIFKEKLVNQ